MKIFIARHGETELNREFRLQGKADAPLIEEGVRHAERLGDYFKGKGTDMGFTSTLGRSKKTAEKIAGKTGLSFEERPELDEISYGILDTLTREEADKKFPGMWEIRLKDRFNFELEGAEDYSDVEKRLKPFVNELREKYANKKILIVGHYNMNRILIGILLGLGHDEVVAIDVPHEIVYEIELNGESKVRRHSIDSGEENEGLLLLKQ